MIFCDLMIYYGTVNEFSFYVKLPSHHYSGLQAASECSFIIYLSFC